MNISKWPLGRIMQLPDHCFGRRWLIGMGVLSLDGDDAYAIVQTGVPDRGVIWELCVLAGFAISFDVAVEFAWGDQLPTTAAEWASLEKMFPCQGCADAADWFMWGSPGGNMTFRRLKMVMPGSGKRPVMRVARETLKSEIVSAWFVVSSLPKEIPDWTPWV